MSRETLMLVSLDEIRGIKRHCHQCGAAISCPIHNPLMVPETCPVCRELTDDVQGEDVGRGIRRQMGQLASALKDAQINRHLSVWSVTLEIATEGPAPLTPPPTRERGRWG